MNASARMRHNDKGRYAVVINRLCRSALVGLGVLLAFLSAPAHAQSNPKTITMVVPYAAGGGTDTVARLIGERMSRTLGQTIIIENVVGGGSTLANDRVARSAPDGSTILINHVALLAAQACSPTCATIRRRRSSLSASSTMRRWS
jgi:tripartite-type tricarboxylate transporter receptor subunit TctC